MSKSSMDAYNEEHARRVARALPSTHQPGVRFGRAAQAATRDDDRIRTHKIEQYVQWHQRRYGTDPNEEAILSYLGEDDTPDGAA
jgi:hypothetical protein